LERTEVTVVERRVRGAGVIIAVGLALELVSLIPTHALAFIGFAVIGAPLVALGVVLFLLAIVSQPAEHAEAGR
jgi:hypothetical protein